MEGGWRADGGFARFLRVFSIFFVRFLIVFHVFERLLHVSCTLFARFFARFLYIFADGWRTDGGRMKGRWRTDGGHSRLGWS